MLLAMAIAAVFEARTLVTVFLALYLAVTVVPLAWRLSTANAEAASPVRTPPRG